MVSAMPRPHLARTSRRRTALRRARFEVAAAVVDPEIPVLTIADLGVLRDVKVGDGAVEVIITPTYSGCPAMNVIALEVEMALNQAASPMPRVKTVLSPAWTTDWMTEQGKAKLADYGIAPPEGKARAAHYSARSGSPVRAAARPTPNASPSSARPPARRCGAAAPAPSRSIISSASETT